MKISEEFVCRIISQVIYFDLSGVVLVPVRLQKRSRTDDDREAHRFTYQ